MKCENCGKNEANVKYTQIINGEKKQMFLCQECSAKLGIDSNIHLNMPINFSSFLSDFFDDVSGISSMPIIGKALECPKCGLTFDEFMNTGKFGCSNCYDEFESKIDPILKNIQGSNRHMGRLGSVIEGNDIKKDSNQAIGANQSENVQDNLNATKLNHLEELKANLKLAIKEERYEDAAKIRDEIKKEGSDE